LSSENRLEVGVKRNLDTRFAPLGQPCGSIRRQEDAQHCSRSSLIPRLHPLVARGSYGTTVGNREGRRGELPARFCRARLRLDLGKLRDGSNADAANVLYDLQRWRRRRQRRRQSSRQTECQWDGGISVPRCSSHSTSVGERTTTCHGSARRRDIHMRNANTRITCVE